MAVATDARETGPRPAAACGPAELGRHRQGLRMALGMAASFTLAEALDWELSFLVPVLVVQMLAAMPAPPSLRQGVLLVLQFGATAGSAVIVSRLLADMPVPFTLVLGLVFFGAFYLQARGQGGLLATLLLLSFSLVPVVSVQAPDIATAAAWYVFRSGLAAILWVWLMFALFPPPAPPRGAAAATPAAPLEPAAAVRRALTHTLILLPVLVVALTFAVGGVVLIVLTLAALLGQHSVTRGQRAALGLFLGNVMGGATAIAAYGVLQAAPTLGVLACLLLLVGLIYGFAIAGATSRAPILIVALVTFIIVFGTGVAPFLDEPGASLASRLVNLGLACAYALLALTATDRRARGAARQANRAH